MYRPRQAKVLDLLLREEDNIATFLNFSILDGVRQSLITYIRDHLSEADESRSSAENGGDRGSEAHVLDYL
jgi:hypothetical protein